MTQHDRVLIDTSVLIDVHRIPADVISADVAIAAVSLAELAAGPHATEDRAERALRQRRLQWAEATFDTLPFDATAARCYGQAYALVLSAGRKPRRRLADLLIASVAAANALPLYTRNPADFAGLESLIDVFAV